MKTLTVFGIIGAAALAFGTLYSNNAGAPAGKAGDKGVNQTCISCHTGNSMGAGNTTVVATLLDANGGLVDKIAPNTTYTVRVVLSSQSASFATGGFEVTALATGSSGSAPSVGTFSAGNMTQTVSEGNRTYVTHTGSKPSKTNSWMTWEFSWTSPADVSSGVTFYAAGVAANGDGTNSGDYVTASTIDYPAAATGIAARPLPSSIGRIQGHSGRIEAEWSAPVATWYVLSPRGSVVRQGGTPSQGQEVLADGLPTGLYHVMVQSLEGAWFSRTVFVP